MSKFVQIKPSRVHAKGLYAKCAIAEDAPIIEYIGDKVTHKQAENSISGSGCIYWFELNQRYLVSGRKCINLRSAVKISQKFF